MGGNAAVEDGPSCTDLSVREEYGVCGVAAESPSPLRGAEGGSFDCARDRPFDCAQDRLGETRGLFRGRRDRTEFMSMQAFSFAEKDFS